VSINKEKLNEMNDHLKIEEQKFFEKKAAY